MGHQDQRRPPRRAGREQQVGDAAARGLVEVAGRLVGHDDGGVGRERPGEGDALLLATRELRRVVAEAMAEYTHKRIRAELGYAGEDDRDMEKMLAQQYRGSRYSFGYPACPKLDDQPTLLRLLDAERIGV